MRALRLIIVTCCSVVGGAACSSDDARDPGWAIVKVEVLDGPALRSICIDSISRDFDGDVRSGEYAAFVEAGTRFEVLRVGDQRGAGAGAGSPVGGCVLLEISSDGASFTAGCGVAPDDIQT